MTVEPLPFGVRTPLGPDEPLGSERSDAGDAGRASGAFATAVERAFGDAGASLERAAFAERSFASGHGGLQEMVLERAQADVALSLAAAAASRVSQALSTVLGMQV